jgi:hypothetical protein
MGAFTLSRRFIGRVRQPHQPLQILFSFTSFTPTLESRTRPSLFVFAGTPFCWSLIKLGQTLNCLRVLAGVDLPDTMLGPQFTQSRPAHRSMTSISPSLRLSSSSGSLATPQRFQVLGIEAGGAGHVLAEQAGIITPE